MSAVARRPLKQVYRCARCGRRLKRWTYSRFTGNRYCWQGEGCCK